MRASAAGCWAAALLCGAVAAERAGEAFSGADVATEPLTTAALFALLSSMAIVGGVLFSEAKQEGTPASAASAEAARVEALSATERRAAAMTAAHQPAVRRTRMQGQFGAKKFIKP